MDIDGLTPWVSSHGMQETIQRMRNAILAQGMKIFAQIDHGQAASEAGLELRPLQVLIFGNVLSSTTLMQSKPTTGIDLPLRAVVWVDDEGSTWLAYNDPGWIAARHGARLGNEQVLLYMRRTLTAIAEYVIYAHPAG
ncbi:DUF302 domain-containing protein (plasmid) [Roseomonas sp. CCTCC AB2023176]|uniref:DUF302 domain-containing protein n=1 Tax=Roseomonas sp. CCTCC AB2023176 TaxID=3342640 RepID=UPI0035DA42FF